MSSWPWAAEDRPRRPDGGIGNPASRIEGQDSLSVRGVAGRSRDRWRPNGGSRPSGNNGQPPPGRRQGDFNAEIEHLGSQRRRQHRGHQGQRRPGHRDRDGQLFGRKYLAAALTAIDWDSVADIRDVVQVVDGQWAKDGDNIRTMSTGYDRIVALGDMGWDDFQVTVPVTIHAFPDPNAGGVGVVARWQGHFQIDDEQPGRGWWQIGAYGFYRNREREQWRAQAGHLHRAL